MALNVKIDVKDVYRIVIKDAGQRASAFDSILTNGEEARLGIKIAKTTHPLMPNVYNLTFGPLNQDGSIDDKARLSHQNYSRVFSTVLFEAISFLEQHPNDYVGIDGSDNARAYMYYRCIQNNLAYLRSIFTILGVKYYIRMLREGKDGNCDLDTEDIITTPEPIEAKQTMQPEKLYNYFIFKLRSGETSISSNF